MKNLRILNFMKKKHNQDYFDVMRKIDKQPESSQRYLAEGLVLA